MSRAARVVSAGPFSLVIIAIVLPSPSPPLPPVRTHVGLLLAAAARWVNMYPLLSGFTALGLAGCLVPKPSIRATKQIQIQSIGTVAVLPFSGHDGEQFSDHVTQELILRGAKVNCGFLWIA